MATYNDIKKIKIGNNTFVFHIPTASEVGALPSSTTIPAITLNGSGSTSPSFYAPTTVGTSGYVLKSNGSGAPTWTSATLTDTKVTTAALTSGTLYYPILATGTGTATRQIDSTIKGLTYKSTAGTTSTVGKAELTLGNGTASGTANNEQGQLILYGSTAYKHTIEGAPTANRTITLPNDSGTVALTDQLYIGRSGSGYYIGSEGEEGNNGTVALSAGNSCDAIGRYSTALGEHTYANGRSQLAIGAWNKIDTEDDEGGNYYKKYAFIIGNGTSESARSDAFAIDWNGNVTAAGAYDGPLETETISSFSSGWTYYNSAASNKPVVRKFGKIVTLTGALSNTTSKTLNATETTVFSISAKYAPVQELVFLSQGTGTNVFAVRVKTTGAVTFERYRANTTSYSSISSGAWFPFHTTWIID